MGFQVDKWLGRLEDNPVHQFLNLTDQKGYRKRLRQEVDV
jgi:hypothetical protein